MVHIYNEIILSHKKERNWDDCLLMVFLMYTVLSTVPYRIEECKVMEWKKLCTFFDGETSFH